MLTYAETPKWVTITGRSLIYDDWGRLWVAIQRTRNAVSYFSIFSDTTFVGSVRVRDRVEGYDLLGSTLAVLVERLPDDPAGIPGRVLTGTGSSRRVATDRLEGRRLRSPMTLLGCSCKPPLPCRSRHSRDQY